MLIIAVAFLYLSALGSSKVCSSFSVVYLPAKSVLIWEINIDYDSKIIDKDNYWSYINVEFLFLDNCRMGRPQIVALAHSQ
jgi:hypothetical protein